ncbi:MAG: LON peptidase substrate-binding domain-containing protein [Spirochaetaceae bacterium]|jgi:ATP-dependent Lon protease|nr:LON peptidase substrate-binding domain-containing protein [Spirochaetaceae bacterium]
MKIGKLQHNNRRDYPLVPMGDLVIFPHVVVPFFVKKSPTVSALELALKKDRDIIVGYQKYPAKSAQLQDFHEVATLCHVLQVLKLPDGNMRVLVEGRERCKLNQINKKEEIVIASVKLISESNDIDGDIYSLMQTLQNSFLEFSKVKKRIPRELVSHVKKAETPSRLISHIASGLNISIEQKLFYLEDRPIKQRLEELAVALQM